MKGKLALFIGWLLYKLGRKPTLSTGIGAGTTAGYGELGELGFWEYSVPGEFWEKRRASRRKD